MTHDQLTSVRNTRPPRPHLVATLPIMLVLAFAGLGVVAPNAPAARARPDAAIECDCELRSWIVAGRGRHLLLDIDCPDDFNGLDGVVEFTTAAFRDDYDPLRDESGAPRVARMTPGQRLKPFLAPGGGVFPDERIDASWKISLDAARCLQRDRLFAHQYFLLGPNSNSAIASVLAACGLETPVEVRAGAGVFGEYPGVDLDPGPEVPRAEWPAFGIVFTE